jgi:hypothetical protein
MRFDSSARTQHLLRKTWNSDPRLLRFSVVRVGGKLGEICDVGGRAEEWNGIEGAEGAVEKGFEMTEGEERREEVGFLERVLRDERAMASTTGPGSHAGSRGFGTNRALGTGGGFRYKN